MTPLVSVRGLEKSVPTKPSPTWLLRRISFDVNEGDFVSIMGPSGAGKSTLLHILGLYDHGWQGEFFLEGQPVHSMKPKERAALNRSHVGFVFQQFHLLDDLTVAENLEEPLRYRDLKSGERQARVGDILDRFGIVGKKDLYPSQLSGGQQQLVAVARAVVARPRLLLADEPTGNLHSDQAREIMGLFKRLNDEGATVIQVTHSQENAAHGNRVVKLRDGWMDA